MKIIVGGGVSGLWLAAELTARNIPCCVLESHQLGQGQTLASQGMIHGGTKYALDGLLSKAASAIAAMPDRWRQAIAGQGTVDLSAVALEREHQLLWSHESLAANLVGFFASKAMRSRMQRIKPEEEPAFANGFDGHLYRLSEPVLLLDTLIPAFENLLTGRLFSADVVKLIARNDRIIGVETTQGDLFGEVILTAGEGTEGILERSGLHVPRMQRRPLAMAVCTLNTPLPAPIFGHQLGVGSKPKLTISTHQVRGQQCLYLGGQLAEDGVERSDQAQQLAAESAVSEALSWLTPDIGTTHVFRVARAEPATDQGARPDHPFIQTIKGGFVCWPTKLALAPQLSDMLIPQLQPSTGALYPAWPAATQGTYPWASH